MTEPEWKAELRRQLEAADEAQVRAELRELSAGGEDRRQFVVGWREKEKTRSSGKIGFTGECSRLRASRSPQ